MFARVTRRAGPGGGGGAASTVAITVGDAADGTDGTLEPMAERDPDQLPRDPDWDHVPEPLGALDERPVIVAGIDRETGEPVELTGTLAIVPGLSGDAARREQP